MSKTAWAKTHTPLRAVPLLLCTAALTLTGCGPSREVELAAELAKAKAETEEAKTAQKQAEQELANAQSSAQPAPIIVEDDSETGKDEDSSDDENATEDENASEDQADDSNSRQAQNEVPPAPDFSERIHVSKNRIE